MPTVALSALDNASKILAAGRKIQSGHIRTLTENIANANSTAKTPGGDPYSRKTAVFSPIISDSDEDPVGQIIRSTDNYRTKYNPADVAADARGYVKMPNINVSEEDVKLQAVIRAYELNLGASASIDAAAKATLDLLK